VQAAGSSSSPTSASTRSPPRRRRRRIPSATCRSHPGESRGVHRCCTSPSAVLTGMVHYSELTRRAGRPRTLTPPRSSLLAGWIKLGAIAGMTSVVWDDARTAAILYAMSRDGTAARCPPRAPDPQTPYVGHAVTARWPHSSPAVPVTIRGESCRSHAASPHHHVCIGVLVLRTRGRISPPLQVPAPGCVHLGPLVCTGMMLSLPQDTGSGCSGGRSRVRDLRLLRFRHSELRKAAGGPSPRTTRTGPVLAGRTASRRVAQSEATTAPPACRG